MSEDLKRTWISWRTNSSGVVSATSFQWSVVYAWRSAKHMQDSEEYLRQTNTVGSFPVPLRYSDRCSEGKVGVIRYA